MTEGSTESAREGLLSRLEALYGRLALALPQPSGNACGSCRECCTGDALSFHNVTAVEMDYISERVGPERIEAFRGFLRREGGAVCPYFDEERWGCGIYAHRPFSCRVFGHYRSEGTALPKVCVLAGQEKIFGRGEYSQAIPEAVELRDLARAFWPFQTERTDAGAQWVSALPEAGAAAPGGDALDRALALMSQGRLQEALEEFEASDLPSTPYVLYCLSLVFEGLKRHGDACTALEVAVGEAPRSVPLWFRLACNRFSCGRLEDAEVAFCRTLELQPEHALARGLLGSHYLSSGRPLQAVEHLRVAKRLQPDSPIIAKHLALAELLL